MPPRLLVFDLDGTLIDTAQDLIGTLNILLVDEGLAEVPLAEARHLVGAGIKPLLTRALTAQIGEPAPDRVEALYDTYLSLYEPRMVETSRPFPGLIDTLDRFAAEGWRFAVCTNKLEGLSVEMLRRLAILERFDAVCGGDTFPVKKPDAGHLLGTIARAGGDPTRAIMIGDSAADIDAARGANVPSVGVTFGYTPVPVTELAPTRVIDHFDHLWDAVTQMNIR